MYMEVEFFKNFNSFNLVLPGNCKNLSYFWIVIFFLILGCNYCEALLG